MSFVRDSARVVTASTGVEAASAGAAIGTTGILLDRFPFLKIYN